MKIGQAPSTEKQQLPPRLILWLGIFFFLFGLLIGGFLAIDTVSLIGGAEPMTVSQAAEVASGNRTYARLTDVDWQCDTIAYVEGLSGSDFARSSVTRRPGTRYTDVIATDSSQDIAVLITLSGRVECDDLEDHQPGGFLYAVDGIPGGINTATRSFLRDADTVLTMCGYCGLSNSMIGIVISSVFLGIGIVLLVVYRKARGKE